MAEKARTREKTSQTNERLIFHSDVDSRAALAFESSSGAPTCCLMIFLIQDFEATTAVETQLSHVKWQGNKGQLLKSSIPISWFLPSLIFS